MGECGAGEGARAKWAFVEPAPAISDATAVAANHFHIGQQVMAEGDRLRRLQVGKARHHGGGMVFGLPDEYGLQLGEAPVEPVEGVAHPKPQIGGHLVVARARRMQAPRRVADQLGEPRLDVHVDVLEGAIECKRPALNLLEDGASRPPRMASPSSLAMIPCCANMAQWALEPAISWA